MARGDARARASLEQRLGPWRSQQPIARPVGGWVRAIREALGMTTQDLARRMHVTQSTVTRMESSEKRGTVQLDTLSRAAEALDCDVVYALVPRRPLDEMIDEQAGRVATARLRRLGHTMALEHQGLDDAQWHRNFELLRDDALGSAGLWHKAVNDGD